MSDWIVEYDNDTGPSDEGFWETWKITDGIRSFTADSRDQADWLLEQLTKPLPPITWPAEKSVERDGDMGAIDPLRVTLDNDNDVIVSTHLSHSVEFCNGGGGGGRSPHTRAALINLMSAIERDNKERPL